MYATNRLYTLEEAELIIDRKRTREKFIRRMKTKSLVKQKICGVILLATGLAMPFIDNGNATFTILIAPIAIGMIISKEKVIVYETIKKC